MDYEAGDTCVRRNAVTRGFIACSILAAIVLFWGILGWAVFRCLAAF